MATSVGLLLGSRPASTADIVPASKGVPASGTFKVPESSVALTPASVGEAPPASVMPEAVPVQALASTIAASRIRIRPVVPRVTLTRRLSTGVFNGVQGVFERGLDGPRSP